MKNNTIRINYNGSKIKMAIEKYICIKQTYSRNGVQCWSKPNAIFYIDTNGWVSLGDEVKCERDQKGFYRRIWVNGVLKTNNDFGDAHKRT